MRSTRQAGGRLTLTLTLCRRCERAPVAACIRVDQGGARLAQTLLSLAGEGRGEAVERRYGGAFRFRSEQTIALKIRLHAALGLAAGDEGFERLATIGLHRRAYVMFETLFVEAMGGVIGSGRTGLAPGLVVAPV
jgi:hypothetical protein